jgi:hypothetical protein
METFHMWELSRSDISERAKDPPHGASNILRLYLILWRGGYRVPMMNVLQLREHLCFDLARVRVAGGMHATANLGRERFSRRLSRRHPTVRAPHNHSGGPWRAMPGRRNGRHLDAQSV